MPRFTFHLIGNAHLDPVWLWDRREGLNQAWLTCRTVLDLMDERPEMTFIRGESAVYEHVERHDPATFRRIARMVKQRRWDVVGGTHIQPDNNLPETETLARHLTRGQRYFRSRFGRTARAGWSADAFGHPAGLPEILAHAGLRYFAFTRPQAHILPMARPAFWWEGPGGSRILAYRPPAGWYGADRDEMPRRLNELLAAAETTGLHHVAVFYGLGDHGGGPSRRQLADIAAWAREHRDIRVVHSGLHRFFDALAREVAARPRGFLTTHRGELGFCLRGCYASLARLKFRYRAAEARLARAETVAAACGLVAPGPAIDLAAAWDELLFNSFHDILPGSSIERAVEEQIAGISAVEHAAQGGEADALNALAQRVDTRVPPVEGDLPSAVPMLVLNPHPVALRTWVEVEACLDDRPIWAYVNRDGDLPVELRGPDGAMPPQQAVMTEHSAMRGLPWRKRIVALVALPPLGWTLLRMGYVEGARRAPEPTSPVRAEGEHAIAGDAWSVRATPGADRIDIRHRGLPLLGDEGLQAVIFEDPWGAWGGMGEEPESVDISTPRQTLRVVRTLVLERGPCRARLWTRLESDRSSLELTLDLGAGDACLRGQARVLWNERCARMKLLLGPAATARFDMPGGAVERGPCGETPAGRWAQTPGAGGFAFATDSLSNFDIRDGRLRATVCRASRYADDVRLTPEDEPFRPAVDAGELRFRFLLAPGDIDVAREAALLCRPPLVALAPPGKGPLPPEGSIAELRPAMKLLALKPAEDGAGLVLRVLNEGRRVPRATLRLGGRAVALGAVGAGAVASWRLRRRGRLWSARRCDLTEA